MKNNIRIKEILSVVIVSLAIITCDAPYMGLEKIKTDSVAPEKVIINEVVPKAGALEIHFSLPKGNPDVVQIIATYVDNEGKKREFNASRYASSILVEGFAETNEVTVEMLCVDNSGNKSETTLAKGTPLVSPVELVFNTLKVSQTFGGLKVQWKNSGGAPLAIHILSEDSLDLYSSVLIEDPSKIIYTSDSTITTAYVRPFDPFEQKFGLAITDTWGNSSDTLFSTLKPLKEEVIDHTPISVVTAFNYTTHGYSRDYDKYGIEPVTGIQNDGNSHSENFSPKRMFNGVRSGNQYFMYKFIKNYASGDPALFENVQTVYCTVDLNQEVQLSRIKVYPRTHISYTYSRSSIKHFKIWGTTDDNQERYEKFPGSWVLIGEYIGPEPNDINNLTPEEIEYFNQKNEFNIDADNVNPDAQPTQSFRYMRLEIMETYDLSINYVTINEIEMFGEVNQIF